MGRALRAAGYSIGLGIAIVVLVFGTAMLVKAYALYVLVGMGAADPGTDYNVRALLGPVLMVAGLAVMAFCAIELVIDAVEAERNDDVEDEEDEG